MELFLTSSSYYKKESNLTLNRFWWMFKQFYLNFIRNWRFPISGNFQWIINFLNNNLCKLRHFHINEITDPEVHKDWKCISSLFRLTYKVFLLSKFNWYKLLYAFLALKIMFNITHKSLLSLPFVFPYFPLHDNRFCTEFAAIFSGSIL